MFKIFDKTQALADKPLRLYLVVSTLPSGHIAPPYNTDPLHYGLQTAGRGKAYVTKQDAQMSMVSGAQSTSSCSIYDLVDGRWIYNEIETNKFTYAFG